MPNFSDWLTRKYLEWQMDSGNKKTVSEFANFLEVGQPSLSNWMNGKLQPKGENIQKIANKLGHEVYEVLGLTPPVSDSRLRSIMESWGLLQEKTKDEMAETAIRESVKGKDAQKTKKRT